MTSAQGCSCRASTSEIDEERDEKAYIADSAADRNGEAGENRCGDVDHETDAANIDAEVHGFFFSGEEQIQIGGSGVDGARGGEKANSQDPAQTCLQGTGKVAHEPESHAAEIAAAEGSHQEHDDGG